MIKRVTDETTEGIPGIALEKNEKILFCGHSRKNLKNPASNNEKYPETVMLTSRRVVTLTSLPTAGGVPALTTIPLKRISAIQTTYLGWTPAKVLLCMVFFLLYVIPGIVFLTTGPAYLLQKAQRPDRIRGAQRPGNDKTSGSASIVPVRVD